MNAIRNVLVQQLGKLDVLFVVDATRDKAAWFNFGPEADARIRRNWARHDRKRPAIAARRAERGPPSASLRSAPSPAKWGEG